MTTPTAPAEASRLAEKHGGVTGCIPNPGDWALSATELAALIDEVRQIEREECAKVCDDMVLYTGFDCPAAIRTRAAAEVGKEVGG